MNALQIAVALAREASIPSSNLTDVATASGELGRVCNWMLNAYVDIQNEQSNEWKFNHTEFQRDTRARKTVNAAGAAVDNGSGLVGIPITGHGMQASDYVTIEGTTNYDGTYLLDATTGVNEIVIPATFVAETFVGDETVAVRNYEFLTANGILNFEQDSFYYYLKSDGPNAKRKLRYLDYVEFKQRHTDYTSASAPQVVTITPNRRIRVYPDCDAVYTLLAEAFLAPQELADNADTPRMPSNLHMIIVWRALMHYAGYEEASSIYQHASIQYDNKFNTLMWQEKYEREQYVVRPQ